MNSNETITATLHDQLNKAFVAFDMVPSASNYTRLEYCMQIHQGMRRTDERRKFILEACYTVDSPEAIFVAAHKAYVAYSNID